MAAAKKTKNKEATEAKELTASEALFGFVAWLSTRHETLKLGDKHNVGVWVDKIKEFSELNNLKEPTKEYPDNLKMPN